MQGIEKFLKLVENNQFVEGHEVLEEDWHRLKKNPQTIDESKILKGLINASTALALQCKGKSDGAKRVWQTFEKYRPLIEVVNSTQTELYKEAEILLTQKKNLYLL